MGIIISDLYQMKITITHEINGSRVEVPDNTLPVVPDSVPSGAPSGFGTSSLFTMANKPWIVIQLYDFNGNPVVNKEVEIICFLGKILKSQQLSSWQSKTTDSTGTVQFDYVPTACGTEIIYCNFGGYTFQVTHKSCSNYIENPIVNQTNWTPVRYVSGYQDYNDSDGLYVRRVGNLVELRGTWTTTATRTASSGTQFATLPSSIFYPQKGHVSRQQGSGKNSYTLTVSNDGKISWGLYGTTSSINLPATVWGLVSGVFWTIYDT